MTSTIKSKKELKSEKGKGLTAAAERLHSKTENLKLSQKSYQELIVMSNKLETQLSENGMVQEELNLIQDEDAVVYKMSGPILVRQPLLEARETVERRIKYIESELEKNKELLQKAKGKLQEERELIQKLEDDLRKLHMAAAKV